MGISACEKGQQPHQALHLLQGMQLRGLLPSVITYSAAISACEKGQKPQQALHLLQEMLLRGLLPNGITCNAAIGACEWYQQPQQGVVPEGQLRGLMPQK